MLMKRFFRLLTLVLLFQVNIASAETAAQQTRPFRLGIVLPLTGDLADYGVAIRNGFELARVQQPDRFQNIEFVYEDSRYDGRTAVDALQKLRSSGEINLYYLWGVSPTEAMLPIAASAKLAVLAETTVKEATVGKPLVIRAARTGERIAQALAAEIVRRHAKSVTLITSQIPFYLDIVKHLERLLKTANIKVLSNTEVLPSEADFRSVLLGKDIAKADLVGAFLLPSQLITFFRQADQAKLPLKTFNADILDSQSIVNDCPDNINGTFFTQVGVSPDFRKRYIAAFQNDIQVGSAAQAYDVANIVSTQFEDVAPPESSEEVIAILEKMPPSDGATGSFRFSSSPDSGKEIRMPVSLKEVRGRRIETISQDTGF